MPTHPVVPEPSRFYLLPRLILTLAVAMAGVLAGWQSRQLPNVQAGLALPAQVVTSSYFGGGGDDKITGMTHLTDGSIVMVGSSTNPGFKAGNGYGPSGNCASGAGGFVAKLSSDGLNLIWFTYFNCGTAVPNRVVGDSNGNLYIAGIAYSGLAGLLSGTCDTTLNGVGNPFVARLSGADGSLSWASLHDGDDKPDQVQIGLAANNQPVISGQSGPAIFLARFTSTGGCDNTFQAIINDSQANSNPTYIAGLIAKPIDNTVYAIGYHQRGPTFTLPYLTAFNGSGSLLWRDYAGGPVPVSLTAASAGQALSLDADGNLLAAFTAEGSATVLTRNPQNLNSGPISQLNGAYQSSHGLPDGLSPSSFIGRYQTANGTLLDATFFHATQSSGKTNVTRVQAIGADTANRVYLAGSVACCLDLSSPTFRSAYAGGEGFYSLLDPQMSKLLYSTYLGSSNKDQINALSVKDGKVALGGSTVVSPYAQDLSVTPNRVQASYGNADGKNDGMLAVFNPPYDLQLVFSSPPQTIGAGQTSSAISLQLRDNFTGLNVNAPANLNLNLGSSSPSGTFGSAPGGAVITSITLAAGSSTVSFYYKDPTPGQHVLTVTPTTPGLNNLSHSMTIVQLQVTPGSLQFQSNRLGSLPPAKTLSVTMVGGAVTSNWTLESINYNATPAWLNFPAGGATPQTFSLAPVALLPVGSYSATVRLHDLTYNTRIDLPVTYSVKEVQLRILGNPQTVGTTYDSGLVVVELGDATDGRPVKLASGNSITLNLSVSGGGTFSLLPGGSAVAAVSIDSGRARAGFYYRNSQPGDFTLIANPTSGNLTSASQLIHIVDSTTCSPTLTSGDGLSDPCQLTLRKLLNTLNLINVGPGPQYVFLTAPLPVISGKTINGGCASGRPGLHLDGWSAGDTTVGLRLAAGNSLTGVAIYGFGGAGLEITGGSNNFSCTYLGTADGLVAQPNGGPLRILNTGNSSKGLFGPNNVLWQRQD